MAQDKENLLQPEIDALAGKDENVTRKEERIRQGDRKTWNFRILMLSTAGAAIVLLIVALAWS